MPDVWTMHPKKLRSMLSKHEGEINCGVDPSILTPRDPAWTCRLKGEGWYGEIYLHQMDASIFLNPAVYLPLLIALLFGMLTGITLERHNRRRKQPSR